MFGNAPAEFMVEVFVRTLVIFLALLLVLRLLGKRMNAQLTIFELAVMVTLGAIVAVPMQIPERGVLQGIIILSCALAFQRGVTWLSFKWQKVEELTQGDLAIIVKEGVLQIKEMEKSRLSKPQVFAALREQKVTNLGEVKRLYMEACGLFSVVREQKPVPGLSVLPAKDQTLLQQQEKEPGFVACLRCGKVQQLAAENIPCTNCGCGDWAAAVK